MAYTQNIGSLNGNSFGNGAWSIGKGQRVWREIRHRLPAGAKVSNVGAFVDANGKGLIPAGSAVVYDASNKTCSVVKATAYSTSATYAVGDYVTSSGKIYVNKTAIDSGESFTSAKWTEVKAFDGFTQDDIVFEANADNSNPVVTTTIVYAGELYAYMYAATELAIFKAGAPAEIHFVY